MREQTSYLRLDQPVQPNRATAVVTLYRRVSPQAETPLLRAARTQLPFRGNSLPLTPLTIPHTQRFIIKQGS